MSKTIAASISEKEFMAQVVQLLKLFQWKYYHTYRSTRSPEGFPDLILVRGCVVLAVELKSEKGKVTEAQEEWLSALRKTAVKVKIWRPSDWEDIVKCLQNDNKVARQLLR